MATRPNPKVLTGTSVEIINAIRNSATINFKEYVPYATPDAESIKEIGAVIMDYPALQNEFINALINRIGRVVVTSKMYENPIQMFKKGFLEFGETVEEIFVTLAKPFQFDPEVAETELFKREIPDVRSAFHILNYQKFYKVTVSQDQLRQAFLSWEGITDLIAKIVEQIYTSASYDEFLVMKYMIAKRIVNGQLAPEVYNSQATDPMKELAKSIKGVSNKLEFMSGNYNLAGVKTHALKKDQFLLITAEADANMDVDVLASAFNMDKAQFMGQRVLVDGFNILDNERLAELFEDDVTYTPITDEQLEALATIPAILIDRDWFMVFDNLSTFTENYNGQGLYWNYFYHVWKTFSTSPFANGIMFLPEVGEITGITVTANSNRYFVDGADDGKTWNLSATVEFDGIGVNQEVTWTIDESTVGEGIIATITPAGVLTVIRPEKHGSYTGIKVTATSVANPEIVGEYTT